MAIPSRQIHDVLKAYSEKLTRGLVNHPERSMRKRELSISGKRHSIIEKVGVDLVEKISRSIANGKIQQNSELPSSQTNSENIITDTKEQIDFVYNVIDGSSKAVHRIRSDTFNLMFEPIKQQKSSKHTKERG